MSNLIREAKYLRVLTPKTTNGINPRFDEFGRQLYKESFARVNSMRNWIILNKRRPESLKYKIEVVNNPDYIPRRRDKMAQYPRNKNPRPGNERTPTPVVDVDALKAQLRAELLAEQRMAGKQTPVDAVPAHAMQYEPIVTDVEPFDDGPTGPNDAVVQQVKQKPAAATVDADAKRREAAKKMMQ